MNRATDLKTIVRHFTKDMRENNIGAYAAQAALFLIMSIIPFLIVLLYLLRFTPVDETMILSWIAIISPDSISSMVIYVVEEVYENAGGVLVISLIIAIYSAAKTIQSLRTGLNIVYYKEETRNWFVLRLRAMIETLALIVAVLLLMILLMFGQKIQQMLVDFAPIVAVVTAVILKLRFLILFFVLTFILMVIYRTLPNRKIPFRSQVIGAVFTTVAWYIITFVMSIYINYFNGFSLYGSLTSLVLIMFWLYFAMFFFLIGGYINYSWEDMLSDFKNVMKVRRKKKENGASE